MTIYGLTRHRPPLAANPVSAVYTPPQFVAIDRHQGVSLRANNENHAEENHAEENQTEENQTL
jgi:hypothetical protein